MNYSMDAFLSVVQTHSYFLIDCSVLRILIELFLWIDVNPIGSKLFPDLHKMKTVKCFRRKVYTKWIKKIHVVFRNIANIEKSLIRQYCDILIFSMKVELRDVFGIFQEISPKQRKIHVCVPNSMCSSCKRHASKSTRSR